MSGPRDDHRRIPTARRFYLLNRLSAPDAGLAAVWRAKQEAEPGTPLPDEFPQRAALVAAGYSTAEDLDGCETPELLKAGLSVTVITAVLQAAADL